MTTISDKILEELGLRYEDLDEAEKQTYTQQMFNTKYLTVPDMVGYIGEMKNSIAMQLCDVPDDVVNRDKNCKLKARLKNYIVLEAFLTRPEKAEKALRSYLDAQKNVKKV